MLAVELPEKEALAVLQEGKIASGQPIPWGSNRTFEVQIDAGSGRHVRAIYKPRDGERPLYDFPSGTLYKRECAAFVLSRALGWPEVPLTVIREGPYGPGSIQLYIDCHPGVTYFDLADDHAETLLRFAAFDLVANNADRKAGHCLLGKDGKIWSIDHGLTFHRVFKMRTVMLEFWGATIPEPLQADIESLARNIEASTGPAAGLAEFLTDQEVSALLRRMELVLRDPVIPRLDLRQNVPWPLE